MCFNSVLAIPHSQLDAIASDPGFGQAVCTLIQGADYEIRKMRERGDITGSTGTILLDRIGERHQEAKRPYTFTGLVPEHASSTAIFLVRDGHVIPMDRQSRHTRFGHWLEMAAIAKGLGIESRFGRAHNTRALLTVPKDEPARMDHWSPEAFAGATTTLSIINDSLHAIRDDTQFGARMVSTIRQLWAAHAQIFAIRQDEPDRLGHIHLDQSVRSAGYIGAASVVGFTPEGHTDLGLMGGNWGRLLRAFPQTQDLLRPHLAALRGEDITRIDTHLRDAGFTTQRDDQRAQSPDFQMSHYWANPQHR